MPTLAHPRRDRARFEAPAATGWLGAPFVEPAPCDRPDELARLGLVATAADSGTSALERSHRRWI